MVSYGLSDGDLLSNHISQENQPTLYVGLLDEVLLNDSVYGVISIQKPLGPN